MKENKVNGNTVLEDEKHILLDHNYDGIMELDHPLPQWWLMTFWGGILFAIFYFIFFQIMDGPSLKDEYNKEMAQLAQVQEAEAKNVANFDIEQYNAWTGTEEGRTMGLNVFVENCVACHAERGGGDIGPNLADKYWINVNREPEALYQFVVQGNEEMGMPAWGEVLSKQEIMASVGYVMELKGTTPPKAKDPQGDIIEEL